MKTNIATKLFTINRYLNSLAQQSTISTARLEVLKLIHQSSQVTLRQLCDIQKVSMPTMSKLVDELQSENLVIRAQSKSDARKRWIVMTQKGVTALYSASKEKEAFWQERFACLSPKELSAMDESLTKLIEVLGQPPKS